MSRRFGNLPELDEDKFEEEEEDIEDEWSTSFRPKPPEVIPVERTEQNNARAASSSTTGASASGGRAESSRNFDFKHAANSERGGGGGSGGKKTKTNGYLLYIFHRRKQVERETGEKVEGGLNTVMTKFDAEWKALSEDEKTMWKDKAKKQNERQQQQW